MSAVLFGKYSVLSYLLLNDLLKRKSDELQIEITFCLPNRYITKKLRIGSAINFKR